MKPFLKQFVLGTCVMFTIFMTLSLPTAYYYAGLSGADTQGLTITLTLLVACIGFSFLQGFWFSGLILKKLAYPLRLTGFANWFPHEIEVVASFFITFLAIFALAAVGYGIYFKKTAGSYDAALARYREQNRR